MYPKGVQAVCPPDGSIAREAPSAALLGPSAPALTLNRASIPPIRYPAYTYRTRRRSTRPTAS
ncbi:hypothetical protein DAT35_57635 [Vitiosangium sp. GDMCC 1.1324]|nr:hypothetical protein DAT35_57635 [Vitiosangium sp. GDMCC 1.1324]